MSVLEQMQRTLEVFDTYYAYEEIVGFERIAKTLVPREAFREAIANALVHRCWDVRANIKVGMFADRIEITSPGGLPAGITEELYLAGGPSVARNPILANVFFRLGHIERFGTGIPRILDEYAHETVSPSFALRDSSITVMLPVTVLENVTLDEEAILAALAKGSALTRSQISEKTQLSKSKAIRTLNALVEKGLETQARRRPLRPLREKLAGESPSIFLRNTKPHPPSQRAAQRSQSHCRSRLRTPNGIIVGRGRGGRVMIRSLWNLCSETYRMRGTRVGPMGATSLDKSNSPATRPKRTARRDKRDNGIDMLNGPLPGKILRFAIPLALSSILQQLLNSADASIAGQFVAASRSRASAA